MIDFIMSRLGYVRTERAKAWAAEAFEQAATRKDVYYSRAYRDLIVTANNAQAQRDTLQGLYDKANRRLERAGMISVTTFV